MRDPPRCPAGANRSIASGTTALTDGLTASLLASAAEIVAAIALMMWKPDTRVA